MLEIGVVLDPHSQERATTWWTTMKWTVITAFTWIETHLDGQGPHGLLEIYALFVLIDYATGVLASILTGQCKSSIALRGILKKLMCVGAIVFGHAVDLFLGACGGDAGGTFAQGLMTRLLIGYEVLSIGENLAVGGIVLPQALKDMLQKFTNGNATTEDPHAPPE